MSAQQKNTFWTKKRIVLAGIVAVLVLAAIGALVAWVIMSAPSRDEPQAKQSDVEKAERDAKQAESDGKLQETASKNIQAKNLANAEKLYQEAISGEATPERKTLLYIDLSGLYYKAGLFKEAFAAAERADQINPDKFLMADWLSRLYEDQENYAKAAEYYVLASKWATSPQNKTAIGKTYYEDKADEMTKLARGVKQ